MVFEIRIGLICLKIGHNYQLKIDGDENSGYDPVSRLHIDLCELSTIHLITGKAIRKT